MPRSRKMKSFNNSKIPSSQELFELAKSVFFNYILSGKKRDTRPFVNGLDFEARSDPSGRKSSLGNLAFKPEGIVREPNSTKYYGGQDPFNVISCQEMGLDYAKITYESGNVFEGKIKVVQPPHYGNQVVETHVMPDNGVMTFHNGDAYSGSFAVKFNCSYPEFSYCGVGSYKWNSGESFHGTWGLSTDYSWIIGMKEGVFTWPNGDRYEGHFNGVHCDGQGSFTTVD